MKIRKPSYKSLELRIKHQADMLDDTRKVYRTLYNQNEELRQKLQQRIDTSMIDARIKLLSNLGQLTEAISKAIVMVVGKETL